MLTFALLITTGLFNGEYLEKKKNSSRKGGQPWETGGRLVEEGVGGSKGGVEECLFEWSLRWIQVLTLQPFHSLEC